jgi:hypothetical protein
VDRQPNDRLGRRGQHRLFQHRRQILRGCANSYSNANSYIHTDPNGYIHANANSHSHADAYTNSHSHADGNANSHSHADAYTNRHSHADAHANSHSHADAYTNSHSHAYAYTNSHPHADGNSNRHSHADAYANRQSHADGNTNSHSHADGNTNRQSHADAYANSHSHADAYTNGHSHADGNANSHSHADTYSYGHSDAHCDSNANTYTDGDADRGTDTHSGRHNQSCHERRKFLCYTEWLAQPTRVHHHCLFPVRPHDDLRLRHCSADSDWKHGSRYQCQHRQLECEHHLPFPDCSPQCRWHRLWQRPDIYHSWRHRPAGGHNQPGNLHRRLFSRAQWLSRSARIDDIRVFSIRNNDQLWLRNSVPGQDGEHVPKCQCEHQRLGCKHDVPFPSRGNQ